MVPYLFTAKDKNDTGQASFRTIVPPTYLSTTRGETIQVRSGILGFNTGFPLGGGNDKGKSRNDKPPARLPRFARNDKEEGVSF